MAAFNFPNSPSVNDIHTENGVSWKWNGTIWKRVSSAYTDATNLHVTGLSTFVANAQFDANVSIGGTLTYEDVKNIDSVGIITARAGINLTGGNITLGDSGGNSDDKLVFGAGGDLKIFHNGSNNYIDVPGDGHLYVRPKTNFYLQNYTTGEVHLSAIANGGTYLYYDGSLVAETTTSGFQVTDGYLDLNNTSGSGASLRCNSAGTFYAGNAAQGDLAIYVQDNTNNSIILQANTGEKYLEANMGGSVDVYHHGTKKFETSSTGATVTGDITISDKIIHAGDTNTAIRFPSADTVSVETAGAERLRITSAGHLLHGVTSDEDTSGNGGLRFINTGDIQIDGDQKALVFRSTNNTAQIQSGIEWWNENGAGVQAKILCERTAVTKAPSDIVFYTNDDVDTGANNSEGDITERLRIDSEGKLWSDRTVSSTSGNHPCLDIETLSSGSEDATFATGIDFRVDGVHKKRLAITRGATASTLGDGDWIFYRDHGSNEAVRINAAGKVLIGTSTPQGNGNADDLVVATSGTTGITIRSGTSNNGNLFFADGTSGADEYRGWVTYDHSQNHLTFGTNGQETFRAYSGRFGIGTASPTRTLEVRGPSDSHLAVTVPGTTQTSALLFGDSGDDDVGAISYIHSDNSMRFVTNTGERLRITNDGILYSYSPDDATPNIAIRSNDTNWHGYLTQTVHGGTISSILSCGGKWNVDGTTYSGTKDYNGSFPTCALVLHNQYNGSNGGHLVFLQKGSGSSTTDGTVTERLRIDQNGKLTVSSDSEPQVDVQATSAAGASMRVQSAGQYAYHMIVGSARHWRIGLPTGGTTFAIRDNTGGYNVLECNTIRSTKFLGSGTDVEIFPTDGMINYGMDGRNSYVTSTNGCYIFSGSGSSDGTTDLPAGTLVLQSRSNVDRDIVFATGSSPSEKLRIRRDGKIWKQSNQIYPVLKVQTITTNGSASLSGSGSWQTMHTLTIDPIKSGSKLWCHWQIQTWWGSTSDGSGDIYVKMDENSSGSWSTFFQNDRIAGNFDSDERRHHNTIDLVDTFPCSTASSFNIRLQAYASGNMGSANFNFFHTNSGNFFHFMEFDVA